MPQCGQKEVNAVEKACVCVGALNDPSDDVIAFEVAFLWGSQIAHQ